MCHYILGSNYICSHGQMNYDIGHELFFASHIGVSSNLPGDSTAKLDEYLFDSTHNSPFIHCGLRLFDFREWQMSVMAWKYELCWSLRVDVCKIIREKITGSSIYNVTFVCL